MYFTHRRKSLIIFLIWLLTAVGGGRYVKTHFEVSAHQEIVSPLSNTGEVILTITPPFDLRHQIEREIETVFFPSGPDAIRQAKVVADCESDFNPLATNGKDHGLFQIRYLHGYSQQDLFDFRKNIRAAYALFLNQGWTPWRSSLFCQQYNGVNL